jgi:polyisoprenoid-binding protein YceI
MLSRSRSVLAVLFSVCTFSAIASADLTHLSEGKFKIEGAAKPKIGPRLNFDGKGSVKGEQQGDKIVFTADLKNKLDMGERTKHAKEDFECNKHPDAKLSVDKSAIKMPEDQKDSTGEVKGDLTLHGVTKSVKVKYKAKRMGSDIAVRGNFSFKYTDFGIKPICRFNETICVEPDVKVSVEGVKLRDK